ncbi:MAG: hypothetical protein ABI420_13535 [Opitutaceae bacterium]
MRDTPTNFSPRPWHFYFLATGVVSAWIVFQLGWTTGQVFAATRFILGDQGSYLYAIDCWASGQTLYRDFAWQYGPLALAYYRALAAMFGNTPLTLVVASSIAFAGAWLLLARLVVRVAGWRWGGILALAGLLPVMSPSGIYAKNGAHGAIEMLLLACCATTLASGRSDRSRSWQLGVLAGLLQWVRFGPHAIVLASGLLLIIWREWSAGLKGRELFRSVTAFGWRLVAGYVLVALPLVIWFFMALPPRGAAEQLWPAYMGAHYAATYPNRWPQFTSWTDFMQLWPPALIGVGVLVARLLAGIRRIEPSTPSRESSAVTGLMFLCLYYALGCLALFHNDHTIEGQVWLTWPALALISRLNSRWLRLSAVVVLIPAAFAGLADHWELYREERILGARALELPNGQELWFTREEAKNFGALEIALGPQASTKRVAVFLAGGGIHHFFGSQRVGRHWWYLPEFVRPWEETRALQALLQNDLILVVDRASVAPPVARQTVSVWLPLPPALAQQLPSHLTNPRRLQGIGVLLDVKR